MMTSTHRIACTCLMYWINGGERSDKRQQMFFIRTYMGDVYMFMSCRASVFYYFYRWNTVHTLICDYCMIYDYYCYG